ncbi:MAG: hypothetical protein QF674_04010, partial [Candidatus Marinimicrobia bacterium]|nr:hypothetical protein [Candidatus Neomarinimicrobiota bacterium]
IGILFYSFYVDAPLSELADPAHAENPAKAPWYFAGLQEQLVYFDPWYAGVVLPSLIVVGLMLLPYLDNNPKGNGYFTFRERKFAIVVFLSGYVFWYLLVYIGTVLRGPYWTFFWPWQEWTHSFPAPAPLHNLPLPLGIALLVGFYTVGLLFPLYIKKGSLFHNLDIIRYALTMGLILTMIGTAGKMILRLAFNIKYIIATPWINI